MRKRKNYPFSVTVAYLLLRAAWAMLLLCTQSFAQDTYRKTAAPIDSNADGVVDGTKVSYFQGQTRIAVALDRQNPDTGAREAQAFFIYHRDKCIYAEVRVLIPTKTFMRSFSANSEVDVILGDEDRTLVIVHQSGKVLHGFNRDTFGRLILMDEKEFNEIKDVGSALRQVFQTPD
jgi:hypothetical protein